MQPVFFQQLAHLLGLVALRIRPHAHANLVAGLLGVGLAAPFFQLVRFLFRGIGIGIGADLRDVAFAVRLGRALRFRRFRLFIGGLYLALRFGLGIAWSNRLLGWCCNSRRSHRFGLRHGGSGNRRSGGR